MKKQYDTLVIGPISLDQNIDYQDVEHRETGGAIVQSGFAAAYAGNKTAVFAKLNPKDADVNQVFAGTGADVYFASSKETTAIRNKYFTADKERRQCTAVGICDPYTLEEMPDVDAKIYHFAGLMVGDFNGEMFEVMSKKGKVAVDVQCLLRTVQPSREMEFFDYADKEKYFPYIYYLKTDAAEAKILTGLDDRFEAAKKLYELGSKEIMISHNTEILVYNGKDFFTCPIKARNLSGRSGRGDTVFSAYITERARASEKEALLFATALLSLKMETVGPFTGTRDDVMAYIKEFYQEV